MRVTFSVLFFLAAIILAVFAGKAFRSRRSIGRPVAIMLCALIPPVFGNMIIVMSGDKAISTLGCYIYFLGMDFVMLALLHFTFAYCNLHWPNKALKVFVLGAIGLDVVQFLLNPIFGHAFATEPVMVEGYPYFRLIPYTGQAYHRFVDYAIFLTVLIIFMVKAIRSPRILVERYVVILLCMLIAGAWQSYYISSGAPIDRSMISYAAFGILVFYFSLYYRATRLLDSMLAKVVSNMDDLLFFFTPRGTCIWVNEPGRKFVGIEEEETFESVKKRLHEKFDDLPPGNWDMDLDKDGHYYQLKQHVLMDESGKENGFYLVVHDRTEELLELRKQTYDAIHDRLTDLYNKEYLYERIRETITDHPETTYCVLYIDVSNFKLVNDIFGTSFGDHALNCVADWIRRDFPPTALYGRFVGDKFGVCLPVDDFDEEAVERRLSDFVVEDRGMEHFMQIHLGAYAVRNPAMEVSLMFDWANMALSTIRDNAQVHVAWYEESMREKVLWDQKIAAQLDKAIEENQIYPWLQPLVSSDGKILGVEALARWNHPDFGYLAPFSFIPVFEKNGMISKVDRHIWRCAGDILTRWDNDLFISVNISPKDFYFMDVAAEFKSIVKEYGIDPSRLRLEITETVMMTDLQNRFNILSELKENGFIIEMDDFGSGYSSLNMLKDMPVDVLKIDMAFLRESRKNNRTLTILESIIRLADELGITSLTEGVETEGQYHMLVDMGCNIFQGYYFAKPMPVDDFEAAYLK